MGDEAKSMRKGMGEALIESGDSVPGLFVVGADTSESLTTGNFGEKFADRFINVGIAEQNMIGVAAGLALYGKTAVCGTYMVFLERAIDQIRNTVCYCNLDVKIIGAHTGISVGPDGGSHQVIEDIAIMRALPNMRVVVPSDFYSSKALTREAISTKGPFFIRLIRSDVPDIHSNQEIKVGKANVLREGNDIAIIACGIMVHEALKAADMLKSDGISAQVIDCHTIKPIDEATIIKAAENTGRIITAEDHNRHGGLGSAVAEVLSTCRPTMMRMIAVNDTFGESGKDTEVMAKYGITAENIFKNAKEMVKS
ncbi:MAG: transketolase family protein [Candidatus Marsarchaeota archaeon]|nr:transketolase family protein [Candidatus Marsarchaeota archaeon]MCL5413459.1 transketolase family protein [Candidatus Marsarchaeota archaeon]